MVRSSPVRALQLALLALLPMVAGCDEARASGGFASGLLDGGFGCASGQVAGGPFAGGPFSSGGSGGPIGLRAGLRRTRLVEPDQFFRVDGALAAGLLALPGAVASDSALGRGVAALAQGASDLVANLRCAFVDDPAARGAIRILPTPTVCQPAGGVNPTVQPRMREPRAGQPLEITWSTRAGSVPPPPDDMAWLFVSLETAGEQNTLSQWSTSGCALLVNPDFVMVPTSNPNSVFYRQPGTGTMRLHWTPSLSVAGQRFFSQLLVYAPGETPEGYLLSPAVEVQIGAPAF